MSINSIHKTDTRNLHASEIGNELIRALLQSLREELLPKKKSRTKSSRKKNVLEEKIYHKSDTNDQTIVPPAQRL